MISEVYYTRSGKFAFQHVDHYWRVYAEDGHFLVEFKTFALMDEYIRINDSREAKK